MAPLVFIVSKITMKLFGVIRCHFRFRPIVNLVRAYILLVVTLVLLR